LGQDRSLRQDFRETLLEFYRLFPPNFIMAGFVGLEPTSPGLRPGTLVNYAIAL
ncbi:hypothetical protein LCGC14_2282540, partial [marine sediment metagenome]